MIRQPNRGAEAPCGGTSAMTGVGRLAKFGIAERGAGMLKRAFVSSDFLVRPYRPEDRAAVRALCCDTGYLGKPIDPVFEDRELFADYLTSYYTDFEPESCFVLEQGGKVKGYLLGSRRPFRQQLHGLWLNLSLLIRALARYHRYNAST
ncbi:MAG: hypothetical protein N2322_04990, partial [Terrimicrobiaceae bacterium]|nr:hypothetical protein [Terrimicrobiaceae bacterium]